MRWTHMDRKAVPRGRVYDTRYTPQPARKTCISSSIRAIRIRTMVASRASALKEEAPADANGRRVVPVLYTTPDGYALVRWQDTQRQARKNGKLSAERIERLEAAGIVWDR